MSRFTRCPDCFGRLDPDESMLIHEILCPVRKPEHAAKLKAERDKRDPEERRAAQRQAAKDWRARNRDRRPRTTVANGELRCRAGELPPHGDRRRYVSRIDPCRCVPCCEANAAYMKRWRDGRRSPNVTHTGRQSSWEKRDA